MSLTQSLGRFVAEIAYEDLPPEAIEVARLGFTDTIATMIAGAREPAPQLLRRVLKPPVGAASLYFSGETAPAPEAAWINGTAGHALDYDDVGQRGHPSTVMVPAILAEGEALGASGRQLLLAYVAGYECWAELARRDPGHHHRTGWHPTGIFGSIGAAAACAALRRLEAPAAATALALGASQSGGIMANFGTMTKPFHAGRAAYAGLISARLAEEGFTAAPDALEHGQGFLAAVSPEGKADRDSPAEGLGQRWKIVADRIGIKKYPACYCTHRSLDAMLDLLARRPLDPEEIDGVTVSLSGTHALILKNHMPQTGLEAKFSMEFAMASAVLARHAGLAQYTDDFVRRPQVQALMQRVRIEANEDYDPDLPGGSRFDQVRVALKSGEIVESDKVRRARGHGERPLAGAEVFEKFRSCLEAGASRIAPAVLFDRLRRLEWLSARELTAIE
ncbi:MAG TPA: MmgE/PrpD family protein [Stellaceae bacterium]|nr:MmgE/PrpD family protein [Stellaceae bacterium]